MLVGQAIEDLIALPPGLDQACHPQFGQMLRDRGLRLCEGLNEVADGLLTGLQLPQQGQPSRVCQHPEDLSGKVQLICRRRRPTVIFVHAHMQSHECRGRKQRAALRGCGLRHLEQYPRGVYRSGRSKIPAREVAGVDDIQVSAQTGKLVVSGSDDIDDAQVLAAVEEAGYTAARI